MTENTREREPVKEFTTKHSAVKGRVRELSEMKVKRLVQDVKRYVGSTRFHIEKNKNYCLC